MGERFGPGKRFVLEPSFKEQFKGKRFLLFPLTEALRPAVINFGERAE